MFKRSLIEASTILTCESVLMSGITSAVMNGNQIWNNYYPAEWTDLNGFKLTQASTTTQAIFQVIDGAITTRAEFAGTFTKVFSAGTTLSTFLAGSPGVSSRVLIYENNVLVQDDFYSPAVDTNLIMTADHDATLSQLAKLYEGDDIFRGSSNAIQDGPIGYAGDDVFYGYGCPQGQSDYFNGGDGTDTSVYRGKLADYSISAVSQIYNPATLKTDSAGFKVVDGVASRDGTTELINVERLEFSDYNVALDTDSANSAGGIYRLYQAAFDRQPDLSGIGYWINEADNGKSAVIMAEDFTWSKEFLDLFHLPTPKDNYFTGVEVKTLVEGMYTHVLHRAADAGGLNYYAGVIQAHEKTVGRVLAEISDSPENHSAVASSIANGIRYTPYATAAQSLQVDEQEIPESLHLAEHAVSDDLYQIDLVGQHDPMIDWMWLF